MVSDITLLRMSNSSCLNSMRVEVYTNGASFGSAVSVEISSLMAVIMMQLCQLA